MEIRGYSIVEDGGVEVDTMKDDVGGGELWRIEVEGCENWRERRSRTGNTAVGGRCWGTVHVEVEVRCWETAEDGGKLWRMEVWEEKQWRVEVGDKEQWRIVVEESGI
jgi:hypothetical protein